MMIFRPLSACILVGTNLVIANASKISVFVNEEGKKLEVLEEELNGVGTTPPTDVASGDFSSEVSSQILDANVLIFIASHSHRCVSFRFQLTINNVH